MNFEINRVAVIIPAYEPDARLEKTLASIPRWVRLRVVVDDGSTAPVRVPEDANVLVLRHPKNLGLGAAILTGYKEARARGFDIAVVMAADGQMDAEDLRALIQPILDGRADYVKGDRMSHPRCIEIMPRIRYLGSLGLTFLSRIVTWRWDLMDSQCGYTAIRLDFLDRLPVQWIYPRYGFPNDMLAAVVGAGGRLVQVPVRPIYDGEPSGIRPVLAMLLYPLVIARGLLVRLVAWLRSQRCGY